MKKFALAGNPNCGKTTLFNLLTGSTAYVGNWPGVTVDKREGVYKKLSEPLQIVDLPGIYSLSPYTPEEVVSRNFLLDERPDCVINIVDATNLERNLYLTTQLLEIDVPVVIALNMMDEVEKAGDGLDVKALEQKLGVPVAAISALKGTGVHELMKRAYETCATQKKGFTVLKNSPLAHLVNDVRIALDGKGVQNALFHAVKLAEKDEIEASMHPDALKMVEDFKNTFSDKTFGGDFEALVADARYKYISANFSSVYTKKGEKGALTKSDKADKVLTHRICSIPIFLAILFAIFHVTFSENFLFLGGLFPEDWDPLAGTMFEGVFFGGAIYSPVVMIFNLWNDVIIAQLFGWIGQGLEATGMAPWAFGLLNDGVLGGLSAVLSFLPQILFLFLFFSILEDSGYMARVAFILDRIFRKFGLSGRAFMPMIMGFGCSVPAMTNTRTLADEKERTATIRVIPFFSCGAKLPILTAIAGAIAVSSDLGSPDLITYSMYLLGILVAIFSVVLMRSTTLKGETPPFVMELPAYHAPRFSSLMIHLWDKAKHFVKKAFTIILASVIVIWFLSNFTWSWTLVGGEEHLNQSILASLGQFVQPIFTPLGFGSQLNEYGWVFAVAAITGLLAKEDVIGTFGTLAAVFVGAVIDTEADGGLAAVQAMIAGTGITVPALIAFIAFNMLTIPCFAAVATAKAELPSKRTFRFTLLFWIATSYIVAAAIYVIGSWWWTCFIWAAALAAAIAGIAIYRKKETIKV
ncbi:MAG: ferrous iron transporter B [Bacillota bacterium]|nr:MAG: ferrous iron transporter B [Bacillota bacterium]